MMDWTSILIQVPLVGIFIWFSLESQKRFSDALDKRDQEFEKRNAATCRSLEVLTSSVLSMTERLVEHDVRSASRAETQRRRKEDQDL
jgi:hypothetical protein